MIWLNTRVVLRDEEGQTAVEYALVIALVALVLAGALAAGGLDIFGDLWDKVSTKIGGAS